MLNSRTRLSAALFTLAAALTVLGAQAQDSSLVVRTTAGQVRGVARPGGGAQFLGIPYAEPPVGALRWREPVPVKPWTGIRDAVAYGSSCAQPVLGDWNKHDAEHGREDCLYLNVVTPAWPSAGHLPVMFWIHGGANIGGSGGGGLYNEGTLAGHGVVLVTINYRLGVFGFLAHPALSAESPRHVSGNYGLLDQILALQWVRANIAAFGGDPGNITVFGQSAGSMDTGMLMTSPLAAGLFHKAIGESGAAFAPQLKTLAEAEKTGAEAVAALDLPAGEAIIDDLRKIPAFELLAKLANRAKTWPAGFAPNVDGWVLPRPPATVFAEGKEAAIPLMLGTNSREFGSDAPLDELRKTITSATGSLAAKTLAAYGLAGDALPADDPLYGSAGAQWGADTTFHCPITTEALWHHAAGHPVYEYEFDRPIPGQEAKGALHSAELPYVFGYFPKEGNISGNFTDADLKLAGRIQQHWTNFAKTGDPNGAGLVKWPRLGSSQSYLAFGVDGTDSVVNKPLRGAQCSLYRERLAAQMETAK